MLNFAAVETTSPKMAFRSSRRSALHPSDAVAEQGAQAGGGGVVCGIWTVYIAITRFSVA
jgi:hypothetical protein